jgi:hypothetical protein
MKNENIKNDDIDMLSRAIYALSVKTESLMAKQNHMSETIDKLEHQCSVMNERNLRQDTILSLICKVWKLSPYIIGSIFIVVLTFTDSSFNLTKLIENKIINFIQK